MLIQNSGFKFATAESLSSLTCRVALLLKFQRT